MEHAGSREPPVTHRLGKDSPRFVLQIGVGQGASMSAWARVCARNAHLIGVDDFGTTTRSSVGAPHTAAEIRERILNSGAVGAHQKLTLISGNSHSSAVKLRLLGPKPLRHENAVERFEPPAVERTCDPGQHF
jgi:hypothetical protein